MRILAIVLFLTCQISTTHATDYYVATAAGGGSNSNTGLSGSPWLTLAHATANVPAGSHTIHMAAGTYTESVQSVLAVGVNIEGPDSSTCVINSTVTGDYTALIRLYSATQGTAGNQHISGIKFTGSGRTTWVGVQVMGRSNVSIYNCAFWDFEFAGPMFSGQPNLFDNQIQPTTYATGNSLYNCSIVNCAGFRNWSGSTYGSGQLWMMGQNGMVIHDVTFYQNHRGVRGDGWPIKATDWNKNIKLYNSVLYRSRYPYATPGNYDGVAQYWDFAYEGGDVLGLEIYGCTIYGAIDVNRNEVGDSSWSVYIHDNVIGYPTLAAGYVNGIIFEYQTHHATVRDNTFRNITNVIEYSTRSLSQVYDILIENNLAYSIGDADGNHGGGFIHFISDGSNNYLCKNFVAQFNTVLHSATYAPFYSTSISNAGSIDSFYFDNNIVTNSLDNYLGANTAAPINRIWARNNLLDGNGNSNNPKWVTGSPTAFVNTGTIKAAPVFQSGTYLLDPASPGYEAATDGTNVGYEGGGGPDLTPPTLTTSNPTNGATGVSIGSTVTLTFSEPLNAATVTTSSVYIDGKTCGVSHSSGVVTLTPTSDFAYSTLYTWHATTAIQDAAGNALATSQSGTFTTAAAPTPAPSGSGKRTIRTRIIKRK